MAISTKLKKDPQDPKSLSYRFTAKEQAKDSTAWWYPAQDRVIDERIILLVIPWMFLGFFEENEPSVCRQEMIVSAAWLLNGCLLVEETSCLSSNPSSPPDLNSSERADSYMVRVHVS